MHRFFVGCNLADAKEVVIEGDDAAHISRVLRLTKGEKIEVCDILGLVSLCSLDSISANSVSAKVLSQEKGRAESDIKVSIFQGVPKGDKLETVVQKCTELGAVKIVPFDAERSVAKIKDASKKRERMQRIAYEAAKQSGRDIVPSVLEVVKFKDAVDMAKDSDLCIIAYEDEKKNSIKDVLKKSKDVSSISIFIGPEGGFAPDEVEYARLNRFESVLMGPRILRTETAPVAALSAVMYELGDW